MTALSDLRHAICDVADWLIAQGITLPDDVVADVKAIKVRSLRRDRREPAREEKEKLEKKITALMLRRFRKQRDAAIAKLEAQYPERATKGKAPENNDFDTDWDDDDWDAELIDFLVQARLSGIALFGKRNPLQIDYTLTNMEAAKAAREYAYDLVKDIDDTSRAALRQAISAFVETPGMTMGDIISQLKNIYAEDRALLIAVTEVTRAYATGQQAAGDALKEQLPDVRIIKHWFTNEDTWYDGNTRRGVCELCEEIDGKEVDIDEDFYEIEDEYQDGNPPRHVGCRCWNEVSTDIGA